MDLESLERLLAEMGEEPIAHPPPRRRSPPPLVEPTPGQVRIAVDPANPMAQLIGDVCGFEKSSDQAIAEALARRGDSVYLEQVLLAQIQAMNVLSADCLMKAQAAFELAKPELFTALMNAGFKAAEQARKACLTLDQIRNPKKSQFIKIDRQQLALIQNNGQNLDTGTAPTPVLTDSQLEAVEIQHRASDPRGQTTQQHECPAARRSESGNTTARAATRRT